MKDADDWRERSRDCASSRDIFSPPLLGIPVYRVSQRDSTWASWVSSMVVAAMSLGCYRWTMRYGPVGRIVVGGCFVVEI